MSALAWAWPVKVDLSPFAILVVVAGAPRTKKSHNQLVLGVKVGGGRRRPIMLPSAAWARWEREAGVWVAGPGGLELWFWPRLNPKQDRRVCPAIDRPYNCRALVYREANIGDAVGFYQGLADLLERRRILSNDKWIVSWDGTRMLTDRARPRVELVLEPVESLGTT